MALSAGCSTIFEAQGITVHQPGIPCEEGESEHDGPKSPFSDCIHSHAFHSSGTGTSFESRISLCAWPGLGTNPTEHHWMRQKGHDRAQTLHGSIPSNRPNLTAFSRLKATARLQPLYGAACLVPLAASPCPCSRIWLAVFLVSVTKPSVWSTHGQKSVSGTGSKPPSEMEQVYEPVCREQPWRRELSLPTN